MKKIATTLAIISSLASFASRGEGVAVGPRIGTLGPGVEAVAYLTPNLNLRAVGNFIEFGFHGTVDEIDYHADPKMFTLQGLIDLHPENGNFRITAGLVYNENKIDLKGTPSQDSISINGNSYPSSVVGEFLGKATFDKWAPYIGIGYGNAVADNVDLTFSFDIGVMFQGNPHVSLRATGPINADPQFQQDIKDEEQNAQDIADKIQFYPVISFGICYMFW